MQILSAKSARRAGMLLLVFCIITLFAVSFTVYAGKKAQIITSSCTVEREADVTVSFELTENPGIWGLKFKVHYNHEAMELESVVVGDVFSQDEVTMPENLDDEQYLFYGTGNTLENKTKDGELVSLQFSIDSNANLQDYPVDVEVVQAINVDNKDVGIGVANGTVTVVKCIHETEKVRAEQSLAGENEEVGISDTGVCTKCKEVVSDVINETDDNKGTGEHSNQKDGKEELGGEEKADEDENKSDKSTDNSKIQNTKYLIVLSLILILLCVGWGVIFLLKNRNKKGGCEHV